MKSDSSVTTPFWRDKRIIPFLLQGVFVLIVVLCTIFIASNALNGLKQLGISLGFDFLRTSASFSITESLIEYSPADSYGRAFLVGLLNTLRVSVIGIFFASIIGFFVGIGRLSNNWLVRNITSIYIEIFRNTPLLVQISIWYYAVLIPLPKIQESVHFFSIYFSNRGIAIPWYEKTAGSLVWLLLMIVSIVIAIFVWKFVLKKQVETGKRLFPGIWSSSIFLLMAIVAYLVTTDVPFTVTLPSIGERSFIGGYRISPEFAAILIGLVIYTSTYIGEIIRGGILSVPKGQVEASKALGLKPATTMRLVIFPQAIRIIIPPVTSQYLNLIKNSSLSIAVGYQEVVSIGETINNQTGRIIEAVSIMIIVYLTFSLLTSLFMNIFNKYSQIVER